MSKYKNVLETIFSNPVEQMAICNKKPPNQESLRLYRDVLKYSAEFHWPNESGQIWRDVLRRSARREFELSRSEEDPVILYKMLITTQDAMAKTKEMLIAEYHQKYLKSHNLASQKPQSSFYSYNESDFNGSEWGGLKG